ncbi:hypothetical protein D3C71_1591450 [compost metagenome]
MFLAGLLLAGLGVAVGDGFAAFVTLDEGALLAHFHLNGAGPASGISLLDFARRLFRQCDFLAVSSACAMAGLQVREQFLFIGLGQRIRSRGLGNTGKAQLLQQGFGGFFEFGSKLGNSVTRHIRFVPP